MGSVVDANGNARQRKRGKGASGVDQLLVVAVAVDHTIDVFGMVGDRVCGSRRVSLPHRFVAPKLDLLLA